MTTDAQSAIQIAPLMVKYLTALYTVDEFLILHNFFIQDIPKQLNGSDCGVFLIMV